jgi:hypothetical protein
MYDLRRLCPHGNECACVVSVSDVLCNSCKNLKDTSFYPLKLFYVQLFKKTMYHFSLSTNVVVQVSCRGKSTKSHIGCPPPVIHLTKIKMFRSFSQAYSYSSYMWLLPLQRASAWSVDVTILLLVGVTINADKDRPPPTLPHIPFPSSSYRVWRNITVVIVCFVFGELQSVPPTCSISDSSAIRSAITGRCHANSTLSGMSPSYYLAPTSSALLLSSSAASSTTPPASDGDM